MSLSREPVLSRLKTSLVCGYRDISQDADGDPRSDLISSSLRGQSLRHEPGYEVDTTNGAGSRNLQIYLLSGDGVLLHCLPGFWAPDDLVQEIDFAESLRRVWNDEGTTREEKDDIFRRLHREHAKEHRPEVAQRSEMQHFDKDFEERRLLTPPGEEVPRHLDRNVLLPEDFERLASSDLVANGEEIRRSLARGHGYPGVRFKTLDQVVHDRMAAQPFALVRSTASLSEFNVLGLADYGQSFYDRPVTLEPPPGSTLDRERKQAAAEAAPEEPAPTEVTSITGGELVLYAISESPAGFIGSVGHGGTDYILTPGSSFPEDDPRWAVETITRDSLSLKDLSTGTLEVHRLPDGQGD